jgi:hypothetical protein
MRPVALGRRSCWDRCSAESGETVVGLVEGCRAGRGSMSGDWSGDDGRTNSQSSDGYRRGNWQELRPGSFRYSNFAIKIAYLAHFVSQDSQRIRRRGPVFE